MNKALIQSMRKRGVFQLLAETFQALGDSSRVQIVWALMQNDENVGNLAKNLKMSQPAVSHHLRTLRNLRLVQIQKVGRISIYSLDDEHIHRLLREGLNHVEDILQ